MDPPGDSEGATDAGGVRRGLGVADGSGLGVGLSVGSTDGVGDGLAVALGDGDGVSDGSGLGVAVGSAVGATVGSGVTLGSTLTLGSGVTEAIGSGDGVASGVVVGSGDEVGASMMAGVGATVGGGVTTRRGVSVGDTTTGAVAAGVLVGCPVGAALRVGSVGASVGVATGGNVAREVSGVEGGNGRMNDDAAKTNAAPTSEMAMIVATRVPVVRIAPRRTCRKNPPSALDSRRIRRSLMAASMIRASRSGEGAGWGSVRSSSINRVIVPSSAVQLTQSRTCAASAMAPRSSSSSTR